MVVIEIKEEGNLGSGCNGNNLDGSSEQPNPNMEVQYTENIKDKFQDTLTRRRNQYLVVAFMLFSIASMMWYNQLPTCTATSSPVTQVSAQKHKFSDPIQVQQLEKYLVPEKEHHSNDERRLLIVGDVHGCKDERMKSEKSKENS